MGIENIQKLYRFNDKVEFIVFEESLSVFYVNGQRNVFRHPYAKNILTFLKKYFSDFRQAPSAQDVKKFIDLFSENKLLITKLNSKTSKVGIVSFAVDCYSIIESINRHSNSEILFVPYDIEKLLQASDFQNEYDLLIVVTSKSEYYRLRKINQKLYHLKIPWLWIEIGEGCFQLGPVFNFNDNFCFECMHARVLAKAIDLDLEVKIREKSELATPQTKFNTYLSADYCGELLCRFLEEILNIKLNNYESKIFNLSLGCLKFTSYNLQIKSHNLLVNPTCPVCQALQALNLND